jgi:hypothetical protein
VASGDCTCTKLRLAPGASTRGAQRRGLPVLQALPVGEFLALEHGTEYAGYVAHAEADSPSHIESSAGAGYCLHPGRLLPVSALVAMHC